MSKKIKDSLFTARWALTEAIDKNDFEKLDLAWDSIAQAKADIITEDVEPDRPNEEPKNDFTQESRVEFISLPNVRYKLNGNFRTLSGRPKGVVVHYTVSGRKSSNARGVVNYLASKNLGAIVMDEDGKLYIPSNFDPMKHVVWHAGKSSWKGKTGISQYCVGIEVCCWGRLDGTPRLANLQTEKKFFKNEKNIVQGTYELFTPAQMQSLVDLINHIAKDNPEFDPEWIVSHDQISPGRKQDPGGSLGMNMEEFRKIFKQG
jgi:N-acetylmuramoyl-L-alanine amidase